jgi:hypothetical protein
MSQNLKNEIKALKNELKKMDARKPEYRDLCETILGLQARLGGANW